MGKLQDALRRVKEGSAGKAGNAAKAPGQRRAEPVGGAAGQRNMAADLWPEITQYVCDQEAMAKHRLTAGLEVAHGATMSYNMLRTRLIKRMRDNGWLSLIVTSPNADAGKSLTALNLAFSIAREQNQRVYLVDADFRVPGLHNYLGITPTKHLTNFLDGDCEINDVVCGVGVERLHLVFNTVQHEHSAELLTSPRMREFVSELKRRDPVGLIIYDAPPLLAADDVLAFSPQVDAVLMVVAEGETQREDLAKSVQIMTDINLLGIVLNKSRDVLGNTYY